MRKRNERGLARSTVAMRIGIHGKAGNLIRAPITAYETARQVANTA